MIRPANKSHERGRKPVLASLAQLLAGYRQGRSAAYQHQLFWEADEVRTEGES